MKKKSPKTYYLFGSILFLVGVIVIIVLLTLIFLLPTDELYINIIYLVILVITGLDLFYSIYLLKKGNFLRLNANLEKLKEEDKEKKN